MRLYFVCCTNDLLNPFYCGHYNITLLLLPIIQIDAFSPALKSLEDSLEKDMSVGDVLKAASEVKHESLELVIFPFMNFSVTYSRNKLVYCFL